LERAASIAWAGAALVSLAYFVLLLPHVSGITPDHLTSWVFLGAITVALAWLPLLLLWKHRRGKPALAILPIALFAAYLGFLFAAAG
jgi:hypothetical protein